MSHLNGKAEGGDAVFAGDGDLLLVLRQDGLYHVQTQPVAVLILAAGFVGLVEALKQQGDLLGGDGLTDVAHRDHGLLPMDGQPQIQG